MIGLFQAIQIQGSVKHIRRQLLLTLWFIVAGLFSLQHATAQDAAVNTDPVKVQQYNQKGLMLLNQYKYDESRVQLELALKEKENSSSYYYLGHIKLTWNEWDSAVYFYEKALQINPNNTSVYPDLFIAYISSAQWKKAEEIADKVKKADTNGNMVNQLAYLDTQSENASRSGMVIFLSILLLAGIFFVPIYRTSTNAANYFVSTDNVRMSEVLFISATVSCILYMAFYSVAHWIWSQNPHIPPTEFSLGIRGSIFEHDGAESFVMYFMMFADIVLTLLITALLLKLKNNKNIYLPIFVVLFLVTAYYLTRIGFFPSISVVDKDYMYLPFLLALVSIGLYLLYQKNSLLTKVVILLLCAFCGLITLAPPSVSDLMYVLAPSLRLYYGFKVSEIYFQYDLFLSYLGYAWMKMNIALEWFPYLGTISFFLFFVGSFFFADKYFKTKGFSAIFIIALILVRIYAQGYDNPVIFQVAPLRLDLWLILLLVANRKGVHHWMVATVVGLLVLFHRNLGLIYLGSYIELLIVLFVIDILNLIGDKNISVKTVSETFMKHLRLNIINLGIVATSIALCYVLFHELFSPSAVMYRKLGFGMLPVTRVSFYWYVPLVFSSVVVFLIFCRKKLGEKYVSVGLFIVLLAIGNSMYFFGRSHENNVLNIAGVLVFALFLLFDILIFLSPVPVVAAAALPKDKSKKAVAPEKKSYLTMRNLAISLPVIFIMGTGYYYSGRAAVKFSAQYNNLLESNFVYPFPLVYLDTAAVKQVTHNSQDIYMLDPYLDFYFYYYGKYKPQGYYSPSATWIFKKDMLKFIQGLLDQHYYVVYNARNANNFQEYLPFLSYNYTGQIREMVALQKQDVPLLIPEQPKSVYHIAIQDSIIRNGLDHGGLDVKGDFTMEIVVKPLGPQGKTAMILNNLTQFAFEGIRGMTFQLSNDAQDQYLFGYSNGTPTVPFASFRVESNKWHYIAAVVNKDGLKVYDNGKLVGTAAGGGQMPMVNSELPLTLGNRSNRDAQFKGYIRELKISDGNLDEAEIIARGQKLDASLNGEKAPAAN